MAVMQLLVNLLLGGIVLWLIWQRDGSGQLHAPGKLSKADVTKYLRSWERASRQLVLHMGDRVKALEALVEELDRAEVRASETLQRIERMEESWASVRERYSRASDWIEQGIPVEEVAQRTGFGLDELRLIQKFSLEDRRAE